MYSSARPCSVNRGKSNKASNPACSKPLSKHFLCRPRALFRVVAITASRKLQKLRHLHDHNSRSSCRTTYSIRYKTPNWRIAKLQQTSPIYLSRATSSHSYFRVITTIDITLVDKHETREGGSVATTADGKTLKTENELVDLGLTHSKSRE